MNLATLLCRLFGHRWRDTDYMDRCHLYAKHQRLAGKVCDRCGEGDQFK